MAAHSLQPNIGHSHQDSDQIGTELQTSLRSEVEDWLLLPSVWIPMAVLLGTIVWVLFRTLREAAQSRKLQDELQTLRQRQLELEKDNAQIQDLLKQKEDKKDPEEPKPGDLIEIFSNGYSHWAIYVGDGYVVHLVPEIPKLMASFPSLSFLTSKGNVKKELLTKVLNGCKYKVNNYWDEENNPRPVNEIITSANNLINTLTNYNIISWNCEHFATNLRYGKPYSSQVKNTLKSGST